VMMTITGLDHQYNRNSWELSVLTTLLVSMCSMLGCTQVQLTSSELFCP